MNIEQNNRVLTYSQHILKSWCLSSEKSERFEHKAILVFIVNMWELCPGYFNCDPNMIK